MTYRTFSSDLTVECADIFRAAGWTAYLRDMPALERAFSRSLWLYGAFDGDTLVGFVRCVGDGEHAVLIQDLIVREEYHRRGIGRHLISAAFEKFSHVRSVYVVTDACDGRANGFYAALGLRRIENLGCTCYMR